MNPAGMFETCDCHHTEGKHSWSLGECGSGGRECPDLPENCRRHLPGFPSLCRLSGTHTEGVKRAGYILLSTFFKFMFQLYHLFITSQNYIQNGKFLNREHIVKSNSLYFPYFQQVIEYDFRISTKMTQMQFVWCFFL